MEIRRGRIDAEVERLRGLGGRVVRPVEEWGEYWVVMQDPEGNEFCVQ
jgi:predicted enzyme related to lactoylglutathione lyase